MTKITIRNLNQDLYTQARIAAIENNCSVAEVLNAALEDWLNFDDFDEKNHEFTDYPIVDLELATTG